MTGHGAYSTTVGAASEVKEHAADIKNNLQALTAAGRVEDDPKAIEKLLHIREQLLEACKILTQASRESMELSGEYLKGRGVPSKRTLRCRNSFRSK